MAVSFDVTNIPVVKEADVASLGITEVRSRAEDAVKKQAELWKEYKETDGKLSAEEAGAIRILNDNLTVYKRRLEADEAIRQAAQQADDFRQKSGTPVSGPTFPPGDDSKKREQNPFAGKSVGEIFIESDSFKRFSAADRRGPAIEIKEIGGEDWRRSLHAKALVSTTEFPIEARRSGTLLQLPERRPVVADLIPQATTNEAAIVYMVETVATNGAAFVAEGGTKPESALEFEERSVTVRKLATVLPVTEELFMDAPAMRGYIEARLGSFMDLAEDAALIDGSGVAPEIPGILNTVGIQTQAKGTDPTPDAFYRAMVKIQTGAFVQPNGIVMHPNDWVDIRLLRTADGLYIWGNPSEAGPERLWGLPVVSTVAATENTGIVADFATSMQIFRRMGVTFAVSDQHSDFFITNKLMLRVEERFAFVVYRPSAICTVTGI
jgi:HK97 family phage major capsid protein